MLWALLSVAATETTNPYQGIVDRNVFGLKPPPPPPSPEDNKPPPPPITLNGITTLLGKRALLTVQMPARPPEPAKLQSFILAEGQRDSEIEVLEIDEKAGSVKVNEFGTVVTLTFDKNGPKLPNAPPPGVPPSPNPLGVAQPGVTHAAAGSGLPGGGGMKTIPTRTVRLPNASSSPPTPVGTAPGVKPMSRYGGAQGQ